MVGWHHQLNEHEFEQAPGVGDGQRSMVCCSPWGCRVGHNCVTELTENVFIYCKIVTFGLHNRVNISTITN